jgi:hypothetical protein
MFAYRYDDIAEQWCMVKSQDNTTSIGGIMPQNKANESQDKSMSLSSV